MSGAAHSPRRFPQRPDHHPDAEPPTWAVHLLKRVLPRGTVGASMRADLDQEFAELLEATSPGRARRWYGMESVKLAWHFRLGLGEGWRVAGAFDLGRRNLRGAVHQFARAPGFIFTAVATIAIGIGATVAIFSVVDAVLLEPLPYDNPDELVAIWEWNEPRDRRNNVANPGNFTAWRDGSESFAQMSAVAMAPPATVTVAGEPAEAIVQAASADFFSVLGLEAELGRTFIAAPSASETAEVVLSHRYWRERFGGAEEAVGQVIEVNGTSAVVVGVLPDRFVVFGEGTDLWASRVLDRGDQTNTGRFLMVVGRLAPGSSIEIADAELKSISRGLEEDFPDFNAGWSVNLVPLEEEVVGDLSSILWMLFAAVGLLQLIACANVGSLFLVRATARRQEMAVRSSLGASRGTLLRQLLTESMVIAGAGAVVGVLSAHAATRWMATSMPDAFALPRIEGVSVDSGALLFAAAVTVGTALLFGVLPSLQAGSGGAAEVMRAEGRGASRRTGMVRDVLVIGEVGLSIVLLSGAAVYLRSFATLASVEDGIGSGTRARRSGESGWLNVRGPAAESSVLR
jgi:putative ABC transport system permease protein